MIPIKTSQEIEIIREGGRRLKRVFDEILPQIRPGVTKKEIDKKAEELILKLGGQPSFKMVPNYHWATCITVNEEVVHGIPDNYIVKRGDIVSLDAGMYYRGWHTDRAWTIFTSQESRSLPRHLRGGRMDSSEVNNFLETGKLALRKAIEAAIPGNRVGHISLAIQETIEGAGYTCIRDLTGHGVGRKLHEEPKIPGILQGKAEKTPFLEKGMVLAIEIIYTQGRPDLVLERDDWTLSTKDGKIAALFEETIVVLDSPLILTDGS